MAILLIFGFKHRRSTVETGAFHCPNEGTERTYRHVRVRRWFSLFFVPLIPLGSNGEHVECTSCGTTYPLSTLEDRPVTPWPRT